MSHEHDRVTYVNLRNHPEDRYNGDYYRDGFWNDRPHFINQDGSHLYYYNSIGHGSQGYWHLDDRDQWENIYPGNSDWYNGGWFMSEGGDFYYRDDLDGSVYLYHTEEVTIYLELNEPGGDGGWFPWQDDDTVDPEDDISIMYDYDFDPESIYSYRNDGVPVLNGYPVFTLA